MVYPNSPKVGKILANGPTPTTRPLFCILLGPSRGLGVLRFQRFFLSWLLFSNPGLAPKVACGATGLND